MLKKDIVLNGISVNKLLADKKAIAEESAKIIADSIKEAQTLIAGMVLLDSEAAIENIAEKALDMLNITRVISAASSVPYFLPYTEEYGDNDNVITRILEDHENETLHKLAAWNSSSSVRSLFALADDMEAISRDWNSSNC